MAWQGNGGSHASLRSVMLRGMRAATRCAVALAVILAVDAAAKPSDRAQALATFRDFVAALGDRDGERGLAVVSEASLLEWQRARLLALDGERDVVAALPPGRRLLVLGLRHAAPRFLHADGSPEELARNALQAGLADPASLANVDLADVVVQGDRASGNFYVMGLPAGFRVGFMREDARWKLDLAATLDAANRPIAQAAQASGSSEDAVIAGLLTAASGRRPTTQIWQPLTRAGAAPAAP
jgi:hypothetical protein